MYYWTEYNEELHLKNIMAEGKVKGRIEGRLEVLYSLVKEGDITLERAAQKANMTLDEFKILYNNSSFSYA